MTPQELNQQIENERHHNLTDPSVTRNPKKTIAVSLETLLDIESAIREAATIIDEDNEQTIHDELTDALHSMDTLITENFTDIEISDTQKY